MTRITTLAGMFTLALTMGIGFGCDSTVTEQAGGPDTTAADGNCPSTTVEDGSPCAAEGLSCASSGDLPCGGFGGEFWGQTCIAGTWRAMYYSEGCDEGYPDPGPEPEPTCPAAMPEHDTRCDYNWGLDCTYEGEGECDTSGDTYHALCRSDGYWHVSYSPADCDEGTGGAGGAGGSGGAGGAG